MLLLILIRFQYWTRARLLLQSLISRARLLQINIRGKFGSLEIMIRWVTSSQCKHLIGRLVMFVFAIFNILFLHNRWLVIILKVVPSHAHALWLVFCLKDLDMLHLAIEWLLAGGWLIEALRHRLLIIHDINGFHNNVGSLAVVDRFVFWWVHLIHYDVRLWLVVAVRLFLYLCRLACDAMVFQLDTALVIYAFFVQWLRLFDVFGLSYWFSCLGSCDFLIFQGCIEIPIDFLLLFSIIQFIVAEGDLIISCLTLILHIMVVVASSYHLWLDH